MTLSKNYHINKTLKNVWHKVKLGKRKDKEEDVIILCTSNTINEDIDTNVNRTDINRGNDPRWNEIELISSSELTEEETHGKDELRKTKKKFRKRVRFL